MKVKGSFQEANIPCSWIGQLNIASVSILPNGIYLSQSHQNPATCFLKLILMLLINEKAMNLGHGAQYWRAHLEASDWQTSCLTPKAAKISSVGGDWTIDQQSNVESPEKEEPPSDESLLLQQSICVTECQESLKWQQQQQEQQSQEQSPKSLHSWSISQGCGSQPRKLPRENADWTKIN